MASTVAPAHQFDSLEQQQDAQRLGMWVFLATELMFFGGLFLAYTFARYWYPEAFALGSQQLNIWLGGTNTVVLLTSSLTMALAVHAAQLGQRRQLLLFLSLTMLLGLAFLGIKAVEYAEEIHKELAPGPAFHFPVEKLKSPAQPRQIELFFWLYFGMTGVHALHMIIGIAALAVIMPFAYRGFFTPQRYVGVELMGLYWHFVDVIWIFLFPLLYLIPKD